MLKIGVVIVDFLKAEKVVENVKSILNQKLIDTSLDKKIEIFISVLDNSCNEKNAETLRLGLEKLQSIKNNIILTISEKNLGYTKGNNLGVQYLNSKKIDYLFIINPDIEIKDDNAFLKMIAYLEKNKEVGILGPRQVHTNGEYAMTVRQFPNLFTQIFRRLWLRYLPFVKQIVEKDEMLKMDKAKTQDVDWLQSSFICIRKDLWNEIGGFNEQYFLFMADAEICLEAWKKGYAVRFFSEVDVLADGVRCSAGGFIQFCKSWVLRQHLKDAWKYFLKHLFEKNVRK